MAAAAHVRQSARQLVQEREQDVHPIAQISLEHAKRMAYDDRRALVHGGGPVVVSDKVVDGFRAIEETLMSGRWLSWCVGQHTDVMTTNNDVRTQCAVVHNPLDTGSKTIKVNVWPSGRQTDVTILLHPGQSILLPYGWSYGVQPSKELSSTVPQVASYDSIGHVFARTIADFLTFCHHKQT